jgi:hypothetical protein
LAAWDFDILSAEIEKERGKKPRRKERKRRWHRPFREQQLSARKMQRLPGA